MSISQTVSHSVSVAGSCRKWFPLVLSSLRSNGLQNISADLPSLRLTGAYSGGSLTVTLAPSEIAGETLILVSAAPSSSGGGLP